jgi:hypothetical protein
MKRIIALTIFVSLMLGIVGCTSKIEQEDREILETVKNMEKYDHQLQEFKITYKDYKDATDAMLAPGFTNKENEVLFGYAGKEYRGKDLIDISTQELIELQKNMKEFNRDFWGTRKIKSLEISDVYTVKDMNWKHVFTKEVVSSDKLPNLITYKKYRFKSVEGLWKIMDISYASNTSNRLSEKEVERYENPNGIPVNYRDILDVIK